MAVWLARQGSAFGLGLGLGPYIGAKIGGAKSFFWSSVVFVASMLYVLGTVPETLSPDDRKSFNLAACSPLRFLKLFQNRVMSTLAVTVGLQGFGDYLNVYDINYLFLKTVFDAGQTEIGRYASAVGVTQFISGNVMGHAIKVMGQKAATLGANAMWSVAMALLGSARNVQQIVASLGAMCFGHMRNSAVSAYILKHGQSSGMGRSEIVAAQANLLALLKVFIPLFYGNLFAAATSKGRNFPGAPYFFIAFVTCLSQLCFWTVDPDREESREAVRA
uniref:Major facilitator superfamily (MFS) profile domain-containing protein n=1 Tax=Alexandrium catenella TaxID=2925 RepID=A0A7S1PSU0_ALECA